MARFTEQALALPPGSVLVGSTGRIGVTMPMDNVRAGIIEAAVVWVPRPAMLPRPPKPS